CFGGAWHFHRCGAHGFLHGPQRSGENNRECVSSTNLYAASARNDSISVLRSQRALGIRLVGGGVVRGDDCRHSGLSDVWSAKALAVRFRSARKARFPLSSTSYPIVSPVASFRWICDHHNIV